MPEKADLTPNRLLVLIITLTCFGIAVWMKIDGIAKEQPLAHSGFIRVGVFMSAVWLALPSRKRASAWKGLSPWVIAAIAVAVFLIPRLKFSIPIVIGMLLVGMFIKPKSKPAKKRTIQTTRADRSGDGPGA